MFLNNNDNTNSITKIYSDDGRHVIGTITGMTFEKCNYRSSKHFCFKYNGIGIDKGAFYESVKPNTLLIKCYDHDKQREYSITVADFELYAIEDDLGWGDQLFCPLKHWHSGNTHQLSLFSEVLNAH